MIHEWVNGEPITAAKLNKLELKKALISNEDIDWTKYTWQEAADLVSEFPVSAYVEGPITEHR